MPENPTAKTNRLVALRREIQHLVEFLTEMVEMDLRVAKAANIRQDDPEWWVTRVALGAATHHATVRTRRDNRPMARVESVSGDDDTDPHGIADGYAIADHIARWDVQAVIDECHAKRTMLQVLGRNSDPLTLEILQQYATRYPEYHQRFGDSPAQTGAVSGG